MELCLARSARRRAFRVGGVVGPRLRRSGLRRRLCKHAGGPPRPIPLRAHQRFLGTPPKLALATVRSSDGHPVLHPTQHLFARGHVHLLHHARLDCLLRLASLDIAQHANVNPSAHINRRIGRFQINPSPSRRRHKSGRIGPCHGMRPCSSGFGLASHRYRSARVLACWPHASDVCLRRGGFALAVTSAWVRWACDATELLIGRRSSHACLRQGPITSRLARVCILKD